MRTELLGRWPGTGVTDESSCFFLREGVRERPVAAACGSRSVRSVSMRAMASSMRRRRSSRSSRPADKPIKVETLAHMIVQLGYERYSFFGALEFLIARHLDLIREKRCAGEQADRDVVDDCRRQRHTLHFKINVRDKTRAKNP